MHIRPKQPHKTNTTPSPTWHAPFEIESKSHAYNNNAGMAALHSGGVAFETKTNEAVEAETGTHDH